MLPDTACVQCSLPYSNGVTVALSCLHFIHPNCLGASCPKCRDGPGDLGSAIEANGMAPEGSLDWLKKLPIRTAIFDNGVVNTYAIEVYSAQLEDSKGRKWFFALRNDTVQAWCLSHPNIVHFSGDLLFDGDTGRQPRNIHVARLTQCPIHDYEEILEGFDTALATVTKVAADRVEFL